MYVSFVIDVRFINIIFIIDGFELGFSIYRVYGSFVFRSIYLYIISIFGISCFLRYICIIKYRFCLVESYIIEFIIDLEV